MLRLCRHEHATIIRNDKGDLTIEVCLPEMNAVLQKKILFKEWGHTQDCRCEACTGEPPEKEL